MTVIGAGVMTKRRLRDAVQYIYNGQQLLAVVERVAGGWRLIVRGREVGCFKTRAEAVAAIDHDWLMP
jgi:hypothetical protein